MTTQDSTYEGTVIGYKARGKLVCPEHYWERWPKGVAGVRTVGLGEGKDDHECDDCGSRLAIECASCGDVVPTDDANVSPRLGRMVCETCRDQEEAETGR